MKLAIFALLLLAFSFAADECDQLETICMMNCCTEAGGSPSQSGDTIRCDAENERFGECVLGVCRPGLADCVAPGAGCGSEYTDCFSACRDEGGSSDLCDDECMGTMAQCVADASGGGSSPRCRHAAARLRGCSEWRGWRFSGGSSFPASPPMAPGFPRAKGSVKPQVSQRNKILF